MREVSDYEIGQGIKGIINPLALWSYGWVQVRKRTGEELEESVGTRRICRNGDSLEPTDSSMNRA